MVRDTFSQRVKDELARIWPEDPRARRWELTGLCLGCGGLVDGRWRWRTENAATARLIVRMVRAHSGLSPRLAVDRRGRLGRGNVYELWLDPAEAATAQGDGGTRWGAGAAAASGPSPGGAAPRVLPGLPDPGGGARPQRVKDRQAFLRGLFLGCGSVNHPETGYHAELVVDDAAGQGWVVEQLRRWGLRPGRARRRGRWAVYLKEADQVAELLALLGAHQAVLALESYRVIKGMRNQVNRLVNAETANLRKAVDAGLRQVEAIQQLVDRVGWEGLSVSLREVARVRLEHPELSLRELGQLLDPPLSKSAVGHRLRRLQALAARYGER